MATPTIFWDFDGTLAVRPGMWRGALMEVLDTHEPGHGVGQEQIRPFLRNGFFWHRHAESHTHIGSADEWWAYTETLFRRAYEGVGFKSGRAAELARLVRACYVNPQRYSIPEDTLPALEALSKSGWRHVILSNHVPELPDIVKAMPLSAYISLCLSSGCTGYEKPHPESFRMALALAGNPDRVWMVGDNIEADVRGAEGVGIPAILVRSAPGENVRHHARDLIEAAAIVEADAGTDFGRE